MTFEECRRTIETIRQRQGTTKPVLRVDYGGSIYKGQLARADSDSRGGPPSGSPFGLLVLEEPGLSQSPQTILQIASIAPGSIHDPLDN